MAHQKEYYRSTRKSLDIEQLQDIFLPVKMALGTKDMTIRNLLNLKKGSIVQLPRTAGENVDLIVNDKTLAKGEVVVINGHFGFRLVILLNPSERLKNM
ncbi:MAG: FliM/FliN family flagellar motor switch protein [Fibrobacterales bacterium]